MQIIFHDLVSNTKTFVKDFPLHCNITDPSRFEILPGGYIRVQPGKLKPGITKWIRKFKRNHDSYLIPVVLSSPKFKTTKAFVMQLIWDMDLDKKLVEYLEITCVSNLRFIELVNKHKS